MKDYNTRMAINVPDNEVVKTVEMGCCEILTADSKEHLLTYGLGPCVGVAVVIRDNQGKKHRLLAHIEMSQAVGISFADLAYYLKRLKSGVSNKISNIEISLTSSQSFAHRGKFTENETKLLATIIKEFQEYGIGFNNLRFNNSLQVQISPTGVITAYSDSEINHHKELMMMECLADCNGYIESNLNIYVTKYGAFMGNCSLPLNCSEEEKQQELSKKYWQELITNGYNIRVAPSFNDPSCMAVYVENWKDPKIRQYGTIPGCIQARTNNYNGKIL